MADSLPPRPQPAVIMAHYSLPPLPAVRMADSLPPLPAVRMADSLPPLPAVRMADSLSPLPAAGMANSLPPEPAVKTDCTCVCFLKIVTMIFGLFSVGLTADSYQYNLIGGNPLETSYLAVVIVIFIASVIWFLLLDFVIPDSDLSKNIDLVFHVVAGLFLIASAAVWFVSVDRHFVSGTYKPLDGGDFNFIRLIGNRTLSSRKYNTERVIAGVFGMTNGVLYIIMAICLC